MAPEIKPFKVSVPDHALETLNAKLKASVFPDAVDFSDSWDYGAPASDVVGTHRLARAGRHQPRRPERAQHRVVRW